MNKVIYYLKDPKHILLYLSSRGIFNWMSDKMYIKMRYKLIFGKKLNLDNPKTFNEKLQWLKLYDRRDIYTTMVDKYEAKKYVSKIIGDEYIVPTIGIYDKFDDIEFDKLPNQFVIKCTHDSGGLVICKDKSKLDKNMARKKINKSLKNNYYYYGREWPYKNVKPRIIIEKYMEDKNDLSMKDYKFFCFNGIPKVIYISDYSHTKNQRIAFFDINYNYLNIKRKDYNDFACLPERPINFDKMIQLASILSKDIPHLRVDFYEINGKVYFGELTFFTCSGFVSFESEEWNCKLGNMLDLSMVKKNEK